MTKSKRTKDILQKILESLIYDIAAGYGTDVLPCPTGDDVSGAAAESAQEIAQLWYGAQELSKYELLAHILAFCSTGDLAPQIASVVMYHYPEAETRLTAKTMTDIINKGYGKPKAKTAPLETKAGFKSVITPEKAEKLAKYNETVAVKKATLAERTELAAHN